MDPEIERMLKEARERTTQKAPAKVKKKAPAEVKTTTPKEGARDPLVQCLVIAESAQDVTPLSLVVSEDHMNNTEEPMNDPTTMTTTTQEPSSPVGTIHIDATLDMGELVLAVIFLGLFGTGIVVVLSAVLIKMKG